MAGFFLNILLDLLGSFIEVNAQGPLNASQTVLTENQISVGCSVDDDGTLNCPGPGTGLCWAKGHNPHFDELPMSVDVGNPGSENFGRDELCSVLPDRNLKISPQPDKCQAPCF